MNTIPPAMHDNLCSICLVDIADTQTSTKLKCKHKYHLKCFIPVIDLYCKGETDELICPYCRANIDDICEEIDTRTAEFNDTSSSSGSTIITRNEELDQLNNAIRNTAVETRIKRIFNISSIQNFYYTSHYHAPRLYNR